MGSIVSGLGEFVMGFNTDHGQSAALDNYNQYRTQANAAIQGAQEQGAFAQEKTRIAGGQLAGEQKLAYTDSGVDPTKGTAAQVQANSAAMNELDAQQQAINAAKTIWGYRQAKQYAYQDFVNKTKTGDAQQTGQILGGLSKFAGGAISGIGGG